MQTTRRQPVPAVGPPQSSVYRRAAIVAAALGAMSLVAAACTADESDESGESTSVATISTSTAVPAPPPTSASTVTPASPPTSVSTATTAPPSTAPGTSAAATTSPAPGTTAPADSMVLSAYFARDGQVAAVHRTIERTLATSRAALGALLAGPTAAEDELGFDTAVPAGSALEAVSIGPGGIAAVELSPAFEEGGGSLSMRLRLAQVVFTVTQFPTVAGVQFARDGAPIDVFGSEGIVLDHPLTRADFEELTPAIFVEAPAPFDIVESPLRVHGTANVFEAMFMVRLTDAAGNVLHEGSHMATSGTGTRGTFDLTIDTRGATAGRSELRLWEPSPRDGSDDNVVTIPVELVG
jgi:germination protein M